MHLALNREAQGEDEGSGVRACMPGDGEALPASVRGSTFASLMILNFSSRQL